MASTNVYFAGRLIASGGKAVAVDRLGSIRARAEWQVNTAVWVERHKYYPYGEERETTISNREKFATYDRDQSTNLDYAMNRYYAWPSARFTTPDPYKASAALTDPGSWNRYVYVINDPVNLNDPRGLDYEIPSGGTFDPADPRNVTAGHTSVTVSSSAPGPSGVEVTGATWLLGAGVASANAEVPAFWPGEVVLGSTFSDITWTKQNDDCRREVQSAVNQVKTAVYADLQKIWSMESSLEVGIMKFGPYYALKQYADDFLGIALTGVRGAMYGFVVGAVIGTGAGAITGPVVNRVGFSLSKALMDIFIDTHARVYYADCDRRYPVSRYWP